MSNLVYPGETEARRDIVEAGRRMYMRGYVCANDGNISARISGDEIVATPSGVSKGFMTKDMLIKLKLAGDGSYETVAESALKPSSEIKMHLAIYRRSLELRAVCHAHPPVAAAFAAAGTALNKAYLQETVMLLGVIPLVGYAPPGSEELARAAAAFSETHHGALLEQHGAVTWGDSVMQALFRMESVEYTATVTMYSKMMGFTRTLEKEKIDALIAMRANWGITQLSADSEEWKTL